MRARKLLLRLVCAMLLGCDAGTKGGTEGGTDGGTDGGTESATDGGTEEAPVLELSLSQVKQFDFEWSAVAGAQYYQLLESTDVGEPYVQVGEDVFGLSTSLTVPLHFRLNASYKLRACNADGCTESDAVDVVGPLVEAIGYFKASNTDANDNFGTVALSGDGSTLAVGALWEDSSATGIGGNQADNSVIDAGAVYVFVRDGQNEWSQQAYLKASNTDASDYFGRNLALSGDGSTLAVSASEDSIATGIGGNQADNSCDGAGAVYVFVRDGQNEWSQQAYVKASNTNANDVFGDGLALSGDGSTMAVGASLEASSATGIGGNQSDNSAPNAGAVYVFVRNGQNEWSQQAYLKASNSGEDDLFGISVALSGDGSTLAVGAIWEDGSATGMVGTQAINAGAVYVFVRDGNNNWSQQAYVKASNAEAHDHFGYSVALSGDGSTLAVGADNEGDEVGISVTLAGAVYVFVRDGQNEWSQQAYLKASNTDASDHFGYSVALSGDGSTLAVGAYEGSSATGIGGNQADNSATDSGAVYVFERDGQNTWSQQAYVKASNSGGDDQFGSSVALSGDGSTLAVGALWEDGSATGIGGNQADDSNDAGAVYLY